MRTESLADGFTPLYTVDRQFLVILLGSLLLHGLLLWRVHAPVEPPAAAELPRLMASLRQAVVRPVLAQVVASPAPVARSPKAQARPEVLRSPAPVASSVSRPAVATAVPAAVAPAVAAPSAAPAVTGSAAAAGTPRAFDVAAPAAAAPAAPTADWLAAYRAELTALFARRQDYPRLAAARGWEGEVRLRLRIARKGALLGVVLDRSSGFDVLDQHALALPAGLGHLPALPEAFEAGEIQVVVPINYTLKKAT